MSVPGRSEDTDKGSQGKKRTGEQGSSPRKLSTIAGVPQSGRTGDEESPLRSFLSQV